MYFFKKFCIMSLYKLPFDIYQDMFFVASKSLNVC